MKILKTELKSFLRDRAGNFAITMGLALTPILMSVAATIDYSEMYREHSRLQEASDAAALSAAKMLEKAGFEKTAMKQIAEDMQEGNFDIPGDVTLELDKSAQEVIVNLSKQFETSIIHALYEGANTVSVKTVVKYQSTLGDVKCFVALNETGKGVLSLNGNAKVIGNNCDVHVNSSSEDAVDLNGNGTEIIAKSNCFVGGVASGESRISPPPDDTCNPMPDPFMDLTLPTVGECDHTGYKENANGNRNLYPGVYCGGIEIGAQTIGNFAPGLYIVKDGSFSTKGGAQLYGDGVTFFFTGDDIQLDYSGGTSFNFNAMDSGELKGFVFFFDPNTPTTKVSQFTGSTQTRFEGILYFGDNDIDIGGDAKSQCGFSLEHYYCAADQIAR